VKEKEKERERYFICIKKKTKKPKTDIFGGAERIVI